MQNPAHSGALTAAVPYLDLAVIVTGGCLKGKAAVAAAGHQENGAGDLPFYKAKLASAAFYADQMLPQAQARAAIVMAGDVALAGMGDALFQ